MRIDIFKSYESRDGHRGSIRNQVIAAFCMNLAQIAQASALSWFSPMGVYLQGEDSPAGPPMGADVVFWAASSLCLGAVAVTPGIGYVSQQYGRKPGAIITCVPMAISWIIVISHLSEWSLIVSRILAGMTCSCGTVMCALYVNEISDTSVRGALGSMLMLVNTLGVVIGYLAGGYLPYRAAGAVMLVFSLAHTLAFTMLPETPVYLVMKGRIEDARKSLGFFKSLPVTDKIVVDEIEKQRIADEAYKNAPKVTFADIFRDNANRRSFFVMIAVFFFHTANGGFVVTSYVSFIFDSAFGAGGADDENALSLPLSSTLVGLIMLCGSAVSIVTVDRFGRKILLMTSQAFCGLSIGGLGLWFFLTDKQLISIGWLPLFFLGSFVISNMIGSAPIPYVIMNELFKFEVRSLFSSYISMQIWLLAFVMLFVYNPLSQAIGVHGVMWIFAAVNFASIFFTCFFVPETKLKTFEEIAQLMEGKSTKSCDHGHQSNGKL